MAHIQVDCSSWTIDRSGALGLPTKHILACCTEQSDKRILVATFLGPGWVRDKVT